MSSLTCSGRHANVFVISTPSPDRRAVLRLLASLGFQALAFSSAEAFLQQVDSSFPGCLLWDVAAAEETGFEWPAWHDCDRPTIVLTKSTDVRVAVQAMKAGAADVLTKPVDSRELARAVQSALEKDRSVRFAKAQLSAVIAEFQSFERRLSSLTPREREVVHYLLAGERNKEIAFRLGITEKTVKVHRARVLEKMGVQSVPALVRAASQRGLGLGLESPIPANWPVSSRSIAVPR